MSWVDILAGVGAGILGGMGLGGGGVLVLYLTLVLSVNQMQAQGINLIFFLPCAVVALILHHKKKLIYWRSTWPPAIGGLIGVIIGFLLAKTIDNSFLSKIFAVLLFYIGIREIFHKKPEKEPEK